MKKVGLKTPLTRGDVEGLRCGDEVYFTGHVFTCRSRFHIRAIDEGETPPIDFARYNVMFHVGPIVERLNEEWRVVCATPTMSPRFSKWTEEAIRKFGLKAIIGKGGFPGLSEVFKRHGCVYLIGVGNWAGALYADRIKRVKEVHWLDLGLPEALWVLEVENIGPFILEIDSRGNSLYDDLSEEIDENIRRVEKARGFEGFQYTSFD